MRLRDLYETAGAHPVMALKRASGNQSFFGFRRRFSTNSQARFLSGVGKSAAFLASSLTTTCS
jgi:hypothetical protein